MTEEPITAVEAWRHQHRWRVYLVLIVLALLVVLALAALFVGGKLLLRVAGNDTPTYASAEEHFKYGSIGSEPTNGIPYWIWKTLPSLYPEEFGGRQDYSAFGFLYETDENGRQRDLPIGISRRTVSGVDVVWLNCATCHVGTWREAEDKPAHIVLAMPSNNLDFHRFIGVVLQVATDERLAPDRLFPAMEAVGADFGLLEKLVWRVGVLPRFREGLLQVRSGLHPLLAEQPSWGPGRVDTFNPYKVIQFDVPAEELSPQERIGVADLPAVFNQRPRQGMNLHWDGNNAVVQERNLSAAIGAGVTPNTVDHGAIERIADWLNELESPPSPHRPDAAAVARGHVIYRAACAGCHGWQSDAGYMFEGSMIGKVDPIDSVGTDRKRFDSYTEWFRQRQLTELFAGTIYQFQHFKKTNGYANLPLDGLWLRGPYLHNGSVPTVADLLKPAEERPWTFLRGSDVVDSVSGGFLSPRCDPSQPQAGGFCFDTSLPGNGSGGHLYGVDLPSEAKADLIAYLLTF